MASPQKSSENSSSKQKSKLTNSKKGTKPQLKISQESAHVKQAEAKSAYTFIKDTVTGAIVALKGKSKSDGNSNKTKNENDSQTSEISQDQQDGKQKGKTQNIVSKDPELQQELSPSQTSESALETEKPQVFFNSNLNGNGMTRSSAAKTDQHSRFSQIFRHICRNPFRRHNRPHRIHIARHKNYEPSGMAAYHEAFHKYYPPQMAKTNDDHKRKSVLSDMKHDSYYLCPVTIGEGDKAVTLSLAFDTGSPQFWVFSSKLPKELQGGHNIYNPAPGKENKTLCWAIEYADDRVASGTVYSDTVTVGPLVIKEQRVECATEVSYNWYSDGVLGLSFATDKSESFVETLFEADCFTAETKLITVKLARHTENSGYYTFGAIDLEDSHDITPFYAKVKDDSTGLWKVGSTIGVVNGKVIKRKANNTAICDSGTSLCLFDHDFCQAVYAQIPGAKFDQETSTWWFPMSVSESHLPSVQIGIGDSSNPEGEKLFSIWGYDLAFSAVDSHPEWVFGGIQERKGDHDVLGAVFLKNIYAIFHVGDKKFGAVQRLPSPLLSWSDSLLNIKTARYSKAKKLVSNIK